MIAYFAALTTALFSAITHKLAYNHNEDCVLFIHSPLYESRKLLFLKDELKCNGLFSDVIARPLFFCGEITETSNIEDIEKTIVEYYDSFFNELNYSLNDFSSIYVLTDNHGADFIPYFNIKKIYMVASC